MQQTSVLSVFSYLVMVFNLHTFRTNLLPDVSFKVPFQQTQFPNLKWRYFSDIRNLEMGIVNKQKSVVIYLITSLYVWH